MRLIAILALAACSASEQPAPVPLSEPVRAEAPLIQWVEPFVGTGGFGFGVGSTFPGPQVPFGMVRPGPDTRSEGGAPGFAHCAGYYYEDPLIAGFSNTRPHGMGIPEYGAVALMPTDGMTDAKVAPEGYWSRFSHDTEEASPGYYAVTLDDPNIRVELTAASRVGVHRYHYPEGSDPVVVMDIAHTLADEVTIDDGRIEILPEAQEIVGFAHFSAGYSNRFGGQPVYFAVRFSQPFVTYGVWQAGVRAEGETTRSGADTGGWIDFGEARTVEAAVGISFVDEAHARMNLDAEMPAIDFEGTRQAAEAAWETALAKVELEGRSEDDFRIFYTALYHSLLMPTLAMDVDGSYRGLDGEVHTADGFTYYTDFSLWDTFRTQHPLLTLLYPEWQNDMLQSLLAMARDGGFMPRWPLGSGYTGGMVGDSANIVFADSMRKGIAIDAIEAYQAMRVTAMAATPAGASFGGRRGIEEYQTLGYVPIGASGASASHTLEYAYADWALAAVAEAAGETEDHATLMARSGNWRNLLDPDTGFLIGRHADGRFEWDGDSTRWQDYYAEGNAWQYAWYAPHDLEGLAEALGGREALLARLTDFFERSELLGYNPVVPASYYWHGNEPDLHAAWIYAELDAPADTSRWVRWVIEQHYSSAPDGLPGNDDAGTLSAWYVFASLGFFPIAGSDHYLLASPLFSRAVVHLPAGDLVIDAPSAGESHVFIRSAQLNGAPLDRARLFHRDLAGATLSFDLGSAPTSWGTAPTE